MDSVNVVSKDLRKVIRKEVDFIPGAWVDFYESITVGEMRKAQAVKDTQNLNDGFALLLSQIADWNFSDDNGKLEVSLDSLDRLDLKLVTWISQSEADILQSAEAKKKVSPETS